MNVSVPFEFTDADRQCIARFLGREGMATHIECSAWAREQLRGALTVTRTRQASDVNPGRGYEPPPLSHRGSE